MCLEIWFPIKKVIYKCHLPLVSRENGALNLMNSIFHLLCIGNIYSNVGTNVMFCLAGAPKRNIEGPVPVDASIDNTHKS